MLAICTQIIKLQLDLPSLSVVMALADLQLKIACNLIPRAPTKSLKKNYPKLDKHFGTFQHIGVAGFCIGGALSAEELGFYVSGLFSFFCLLSDSCRTE
jgi:hypothetical protein